MEHFPLSLLGQSRHKKVAERLQADGIETIKDLLETKENQSNSNTPTTIINQDYFARLATEVNAEELDSLFQQAKRYNEEYNVSFRPLFEGQSQYKPRKRECIPLVLQAGLFDKDTVNTLNSLIALGEITEIYGLPGTGKTFLCHHLAANLLIDEKLRTYTPEVLYIDCEGGFDLSIYNTIIETLLRDHSKVNKKDGKSGLSQEIKAKFFEKLHYKRVLDHLDLVEFLQKLPDLLKQRKNIKMVIFDAFTTHLRSITDQKNINKIINEYTIKLLMIASNHNVSVFL